MQGLNNQFTEEQVGKFVICYERGTHGSVSVWDEKNYPEAFSSKEDALRGPRDFASKYCKNR